MEEKFYSTGEAAKLLGVSFRTIKRWIYDGKIKTSKTVGGHYRISENELERLRSITKDQFADKLISVIRQKKVAYLREVQVYLEDEYRHFETYDKLKALVERNVISSRYELEHRWYLPVDLDWDDIKDIAYEKSRLIRFFNEYERSYEAGNIKYLDYSEFLVEQALIRAGYTVVAKDAYYFNGLTYINEKGPGRPKDLDFIAKLPKRDIYVGIQVKNRMEYPKSEDINELIDICRRLTLRPVLITRMAHPMSYDVLRNLGGRVISFKQILLKPGFPREYLDSLREMGLPVAVYRWPPDYLITGLMKAAEAITQTVTNPK
ncbi:MAG: MerR family transcriptional regulator [Candidatus Baldrarchaeia archaeon]